jgi:hypothetical protein
VETKDLIELYKSLVQTWHFEVNSHWQRSSYFAAFETVAVAGCWKLLSNSSGPRWAGAALSLLGISLTAVWFLNNRKTHFYSVYWLEAVCKIENKLALEKDGIDFFTQIQKRPRTDLMRHRNLVQAPPFLFFIAWIILLMCGAYRWCHP